MGHLVGKDIYQQLGKKIDGLTLRTPQTDHFYNILKTLYTHQEAELIVKMPYSLSSFERLKRLLKMNEAKLKKLLNTVCNKGLVVDVKMRNRYFYIPSPLAIGLFEYTMMRTGQPTESSKWAHLFHKYIQQDDGIYAANFGHGEKISVARSLPHQGSMPPSDFVEVLDYEKAESILDQFNQFSIGICSCRHEKMHVGEKHCEAPLESCSSFGNAAGYLIRNNLAREVSKEEMRDNLQLSKELGLVMNADNVKNNITFICQCCGCCCNLLLGISKFGYPNAVVTSSYIAEVDLADCTGCSRCAKACPVNAIEMVPDNNQKTRRKKIPVINRDVCLGCGVCALDCQPKTLQLKKRKQKVIHPENTYERVILQALERGTLQNFIFDNPQSTTQEFMRNLVGGFLRLSPVKKTMMSYALNSRFFHFITNRLSN